MNISAIMQPNAAWDQEQEKDETPLSEAAISTHSLPLAAEIPLHVALLDTVCEHLPDTARRVEISTTDLSSRFCEIANVARGQGAAMQAIVDLATHVELDDAKMPLAAFLDQFRTLLEDSVGRVVQISELAMTMTYSLDQALQDLRSVEGFIARVQRINKQAHLLALNATIEAVRAGEQGAGFGVVASEVKAMSQSISELSREMQGKISQVSHSMRESFKLLEGVATTDLSGSIAGKEHLEEMTRCLLEQSVQLREVIQNSSEASQRMAEAIGMAVVDMQFQDRNSQITAASVQAIGQVAEALRAVVPSGPPPLQAVDATLTRFTLGDFRNTLLRALAKQGLVDPSRTTEHTPKVEEDVELF